MTQRSALIGAGALAVLLYVVGAAGLGSAPGVTDTSAQVVGWLNDHQDGVRIYAWTATFGALSLAVVFGIIRGLLPRPFGDIFLLGAAGLIIENAVQAWFWGALALRADSIDPATARTILDLASFWGPVLTGATMTMIGAVTVLGLRRPEVIPRWLTILGAVVFIEQAIETVTVFGTDGFFAPGGDMNLVLGAGLTLIWLIGLVVWGARQLGQETPETAVID